MRRQLAALVGVLALIAIAGLAVSGTAGVLRTIAPDSRMHGMVSSSPRAEPRPTQDTHEWMHGTTVGSEFDYLAAMVAHHQEAVVAAGELQRSRRAQLRAFGASIIEAQSAQIDLMKQWLADWYPGRSTDLGYQPMMRDLSGLTGDQLDQAFLRDMIAHHMVAVMMSQQLLVYGLGEHDSLRDLAASIRDEQHTEILQMRRWLSHWFATSWPQPFDRTMWPGMMW